MWQTDTVTLQTKTSVNNLGSITNTWIDGNNVLCDVQDISKEVVFKEYGISDEGLYKQVFDHTNANWTQGLQVKYRDEQYWVKLVNKNMAKMSASNHTFVLLLKVI